MCAPRSCWSIWDDRVGVPLPQLGEEPEARAQPGTDPAAAHPTLPAFLPLYFHSHPSLNSSPSSLPTPSPSLWHGREPRGLCTPKAAPSPRCGAAQGRAQKCSLLIGEERQARWAGLALPYKQAAASGSSLARLQRSSHHDARGFRAAAAVAEPGGCPAAGAGTPRVRPHGGWGRSLRRCLQQHGGDRPVPKRVRQLGLQHQPDDRQRCPAGGWWDGDSGGWVLLGGGGGGSGSASTFLSFLLVGSFPSAPRCWHRAGTFSLGIAMFSPQTVRLVSLQHNSPGPTAARVYF